MVEILVEVMVVDGRWNGDDGVGMGMMRVMKMKMVMLWLS